MAALHPTWRVVASMLNGAKDMTIRGQGRIRVQTGTVNVRVPLLRIVSPSCRLLSSGRMPPCARGVLERLNVLN